MIAIKYTNRDGRAPLTGSCITNAHPQFAQNSARAEVSCITNAHPQFAQNSARAEVSMSMNAEGSKTWARMTKENIGKSIAIA
ncbi:MAG: hypothetical protein CR965_02550, partial [Paludibacter sp.]